MRKLIPIPSGHIAEMTDSFADDGAKIKVPLAKGIDLDQLTSGDEDPLFVTIDALTDTISGNKRRWTQQELFNVAEQVMSKKPDGYQGHLKQEDRSSKSPDAVTMWLGAKVATHKGKQRLFIKGYVLPKAGQFKDYLRRASAAGKNVAVSVYGQAMETWNETAQAFDISNFDLESIDWARPGSEGVKNSGFLKLTAEMKEGDEMDKVAILKATTVSEMQENNPSVVQEIETSAQAELKKTISEMRKTLGLKEDADLPKVIGEMKAQAESLSTQVAEAEVDKQLGNRVTNVAARQALRKMVIGEMKSTELTAVQETIETVLKTPEAEALVKAFKAPAVLNGNQDNRDNAGGSRFIKK